MRSSFVGWVLSGIALLLAVGLLVQIGTDDKPCANSISCIKDLSGVYDKRAGQAEFEGATLPPPSEIVAVPALPSVLGNTTLEKRIEVDLSKQRLYAYEGERIVYEFPVSSGKWYPTPTGTFKIWVKLRYTRMSGGDPARGTYYNLPNVPYVMFYYNDEIARDRGFSLHGTYWHNNFGHPMSHGCVNMRTADVEKLYYWADPPLKGNTTYTDKDNPGTKVVVYGAAPKE